jgi:hypothetical protein
VSRCAILSYIYKLILASLSSWIVIPILCIKETIRMKICTFIYFKYIDEVLQF